MTVPTPDDWRTQLAVEWLCTPPHERQPRTQRDLCAELGISEEVFRKWKRDKDFLVVWESRSKELIGSPERAQRILDELYETAVDRTDPRQVPAARAYLEHVKELKAPKQLPPEIRGKKVQQMTDEELMDILAARAQAELDNRGVGG